MLVCAARYSVRPSASPPRQVVRVFGAAQRAQVLAVRVEDPQPTGAAYIHVAALVHFHAVDGVFAGRAGHVEEQFALAECAVSVGGITEDNLLLLVPIADEKEFLIGRKRQSIRTSEVRADELHLAVADVIDAEVRLLAARVI